jgi:hypothetical protein
MSFYPLEFYLKNGVPVIIRLLQKEDKEGLKTGFEKLSLHSRHCRFLSPLDHLSRKQLDYLTEIDNVNHLALCAHLNDGDFPTGIGIARYIRLKDKPDTAEIAITIIDEYQNLGLVTKLLELLIEAAARNGIKTFTGYILVENFPMLKILQKYKTGFVKETGDTLKMKLALTQNSIKSFTTAL